MRSAQPEEEKHQLDEERGPAEDPDVEVRDQAERCSARHPAQRPEDPEQDADDLADYRDHHGEHEPVQDLVVRAEDRVREDGRIELEWRPALACAPCHDDRQQECPGQHTGRPGHRHGTGATRVVHVLRSLGFLAGTYLVLFS